MKVTIHRGSRQIGGCITEYEHKGYHIFIDYGDPLTEPFAIEAPKIEGLTHGDLSKSILLISHYHNDHISRIHELPDDLPIYMGKVCLDIMNIQTEHMTYAEGGEGDRYKKLSEKLKNVRTFQVARTFKFGSFKIRPVAVDHSAFDAYGFLIKAEGTRVFHTGDFRTHGFRSGKFAEMIEKHVGKVDGLVCEATHASVPDMIHPTEKDLQQECVREFKDNPYNIVYTGTTNLDRLFSLYHAACRAGRVFIIDKHQESIMRAAMQPDCLWSQSSLFKFSWNKPLVLRMFHGEFSVGKELLNGALSRRGYVLIARVNPRFDRLIDQLPGDKRRYLSMWDGYLDPDCYYYNAGLAKALGSDFKLLHTSGHASMAALETLFVLTDPSVIIPIHTDAPDAFATCFSTRWPVHLLPDGESMEIVPKPQA